MWLSMIYPVFPLLSPFETLQMHVLIDPDGLFLERILHHILSPVLSVSSVLSFSPSLFFMSLLQ